MKLAEYLSIHNVSQAEFGARIGSAQASVSRYCNGRIPEDKETMRAIMRETGGLVTANDFFTVEAAE